MLGLLVFSKALVYYHLSQRISSLIMSHIRPQHLIIKSSAAHLRERIRRGLPVLTNWEREQVYHLVRKAPVNLPDLMRCVYAHQKAYATLPKARAVVLQILKDCMPITAEKVLEHYATLALESYI